VRWLQCPGSRWRSAGTVSQQVVRQMFPKRKAPTLVWADIDGSLEGLVTTCEAARGEGQRKVSLLGRPCFGHP
jgi:hypothetical protein